jgi:UDP-glucose 4-epimerase
MMGILIIGHTGFIGRHIAEYFQRLSPGKELVGFSSSAVDLRERGNAEKLIPYFRSDTTVVMCAAIKRQMGDSLDICQQNLQMVENLCRVIEQKPIGKLVYFSSAAVYGEDIHNTSIAEETPVQARTFYGIAKYASERMLWKVMESQPASQLAILRPPLFYGIGDKSKGYGPAGFLDKLLRDEEIVMWGDGSELREFLFAGDVARIVYELCHNDYCGVINPVSGQSHSFHTVLEHLVEITGKKANISVRERTKEKVDNVFCDKVFSQVCSGFTFTELEEGLQAMVESQMREVEV